MASITVRNLEEGLERRLRIRTAENGRSMEQEARDILRAALDQEPSTGKDLAGGLMSPTLLGAWAARSLPRVMGSKPNW